MSGDGVTTASVSEGRQCGQAPFPSNTASPCQRNGICSKAPSVVERGTPHERPKASNVMRPSLGSSHAVPTVLAIAAALAACAFIVRTQTCCALARNPPRGRFVHVHGVTLHCVEHGPANAPPLVRIHGNGAIVDEFNLGPWRRLATASSFDRPGYGHSDRPSGSVWTPQRQADLIHAMWPLAARRLFWPGAVTPAFKRCIDTSRAAACICI